MAYKTVNFEFQNGRQQAVGLERVPNVDEYVTIDERTWRETYIVTKVHTIIDTKHGNVTFLVNLLKV